MHQRVHHNLTSSSILFGVVFPNLVYGLLYAVYRLLEISALPMLETSKVDHATGTSEFTPEIVAFPSLNLRCHRMPACLQPDKQCMQNLQRRGQDTWPPHLQYRPERLELVHPV
jgi:hypothetical protein